MASDGICQGSCNSSYRKSRALYDNAAAGHHEALARLQPGDPVPEPPEPPAVTPWYGEPVWCRRCQSVIRRELADLDDLAALLSMTPPGIRPAITGQREHVKVSGTKGTESPSAAVDTLDDLAAALRGWESAGRVARRHLPGQDLAAGADPVGRRGYLATEITTVIAWLYHHFDSMIRNTDLAYEYGADVRRWHREFLAAAHAGSAAKHVKKPCPRCKLYTLWEELGADYISCVNDDCNRRLTRAELEDATSAA